MKNYGAIVKKAKWQNKQIAVKIYPEFLIDYKWFKNRYAQLLEIDHENILKFYGTTEKPGQVMVLMEYAEGRSLYTHIHWAGVPNYTLKEALNWMLQFARVSIDVLYTLRKFDSHLHFVGRWISTCPEAKAHISWQLEATEFVLNQQPALPEGRRVGQWR